MHWRILHYDSDSSWMSEKSIKHTIVYFFRTEVCPFVHLLSEKFFRALYNLITPDMDFSHRSPVSAFLNHNRKHVRMRHKIKAYHNNSYHIFSSQLNESNRKWSRKSKSNPQHESGRRCCDTALEGSLWWEHWSYCGHYLKFLHIHWYLYWRVYWCWGCGGARAGQLMGQI